MAWYWWLLLVAGVVGVVLLLGYLWGRKSSGGAHVDREALSEAREKAFKQQIEAERTAKEKAQKAVKELAEEQKKIAVWYEKEKSEISEEAKNEFEKLSTNPEALDLKIADLLSFTVVGKPPTSADED